MFGVVPPRNAAWTSSMSKTALVMVLLVGACTTGRSEAHKEQIVKYPDLWATCVVAGGAKAELLQHIVTPPIPEGRTSRALAEQLVNYNAKDVEAQIEECMSGLRRGRVLHLALHPGEAGPDGPESAPDARSAAEEYCEALIRFHDGLEGLYESFEDAEIPRERIASAILRVWIDPAAEVRIEARSGCQAAIDRPPESG